MLKKLKIFLLIGILSINNIGCTPQITKADDRVSKIFTEEEKIQSKIDSIVNSAKEQADYVYDNIFYKNNLDDSEYYLIQEANDKYNKSSNIPEEVIFALYNKANDLYNNINHSSEQDIKNLLVCYYLVRYSLNYYSYTEDSDNENYKKLDELQYNSYNLLSEVYTSIAHDKTLYNENTPFYFNTVFGNGEIIDIRDDFDIITGEKDVLKYQYLTFSTSHDKINIQNIKLFIDSVVKESSSYHDYMGIYVIVNDSSKKLYFNPITKHQRINWNNRRHGVKYIKGIRQDEIFECDNIKYIISNDEIVELK